MTQRFETFVRPQDVVPADAGPRTGPRVDVVVSLNFPDMNAHVGELVTRFTRTALEGCASLGLDWRLVDTSVDRPPAEDLVAADGLLLLGGGDVDSELYGVPGPVPHEYGVDPDADRHAIDVLRAAVDDGVPVLAVCRGSQLLNLAFGGTLVPDLDPWHLHRGDYATGLFIDETVTVEPGTRLASVLGAGPRTVRSGHHQAVADVAPVLRRAAVAGDGVVEAVEHPTAWALGVQWHPEDDDGPAESLELLWAALADAAAERAADRAAERAADRAAAPSGRPA